MPTVPEVVEEREFIRGHRDGPGSSRRNETYTVCRLRVAKERLNDEMALGLHSHFVTASNCWHCPAHVFLKAEQIARKKLPPEEQGKYAAPSVADLEDWKSWIASYQDSRTVEPLEIVHKDPDRPKSEPTYTVCRIGVPRRRMSDEVEDGLHPRYHVRRDSQNRRYVQGNPTRSFDNVNHPENGEPGLGPNQLCPFRMVRGGANL